MPSPSPFQSEWDYLSTAVALTEKARDLTAKIQREARLLEIRQVVGEELDARGLNWIAKDRQPPHRGEPLLHPMCRCILTYLPMSQSSVVRWSAAPLSVLEYRAEYCGQQMWAVFLEPMVPQGAFRYADVLANFVPPEVTVSTSEAMLEIMKRGPTPRSGPRRQIGFAVVERHAGHIRHVTVDYAGNAPDFAICQRNAERIAADDLEKATGRVPFALDVVPLYIDGPEGQMIADGSAVIEVASGAVIFQYVPTTSDKPRDRTGVQYARAECEGWMKRNGYAVDSPKYRILELYHFNPEPVL